VDNARLRFIEQPAIDDLAITVRDGRCVAFVGAGFSADSGGPTWAQMVSELIDRLESGGSIDTGRASTARQYAANGNHDAAASVAIDRLDLDSASTNVRDIVQDILTPTEDGTSEKRHRDTWLAGIPFAAILTTNYDGRPGGKNRDHDAYREVLRRPVVTDPWLDLGLRQSRSTAIALHGQLDPADGPPLVLTRRQYRDLLYRDPGYRTFLRSLFATTTVLFLGKSFDDEYLNELRAEILSLVGDGRVDEPLAYAAVSAAEFTRNQETYLRDSEGIQLLRYGDSETETDYSGFDALLESLYDRTNFFRIMQSELSGLRVLWLDTNAGDHWGSADVEATIRNIESDSHHLSIERTSSLEEAIGSVANGNIDFIISNWGHDANTEPVAIRLVDQIHDTRRRVPVIVFGGPDFEQVNRATAIRAGAYAFEVRHEELFRQIHRLASSLSSS